MPCPQLRDLPAYTLLEETIAAFKESLPLLESLKARFPSFALPSNFIFPFSPVVGTLSTRPCSSVHQINSQRRYPFVLLQSDALRRRHWDQLAEITGKPADVESTGFTLGKVFAMQARTLLK